MKMGEVVILKDTEAFGKLEFDADKKIERRHLLIDHMIDVAACFTRLAQCRSVRRALDRSAGRKLTDHTQPQTASFVVAKPTNALRR